MYQRIDNEPIKANQNDVISNQNDQFSIEKLVKSLHVEKFLTFAYGMWAVLTYALDGNFRLRFKVGLVAHGSKV